MTLNETLLQPEPYVGDCRYAFRGGRLWWGATPAPSLAHHHGIDLKNCESPVPLLALIDRLATDLPVPGFQVVLSGYGQSRRWAREGRLAIRHS
jgi:hypothetical protein